MAAPKKKIIIKAKKAKKSSKKFIKKAVKKKVSKKKISTKPKVKSKKIVKRIVRRAVGKKKARPLDLKRAWANPVMSPSSNSYWESEAVFNPGAVVHNGRVHLFYRALGPDGISRVGYASSKDGVNFDERHPHPVYIPRVEPKKHYPYTTPLPLEYDRVAYASGGGWGGGEDPRAVKIDGRIYLTLNIFNDWHSIRIGVTSISENDLERGYWKWSNLTFLSPVDERHKNWVLFPEKIEGKFALFHNLYDEDPNRVRIEYLDNLEDPIPKFQSPDPHHMPSREVAWHNRTRSAGPPPLKTKYGWLLFYHAMDPKDPNRYKLGALLLDSKDPTKVLYRSQYPVLEPDEWYENDWKAGIIYASGAVVKGDTLFIYYGGGDKHVGVAYVNLEDFIKKLRHNEHAVFSKKSALVE